MERAAAAIRAGLLVAFPTETVYGLGANALDARAVRRIYEVKGRPATSPLIVHVETFERVHEVVRVWPRAAQQLAERHWPGPLTLVLEKQAAIPEQVTAGLGTVGVRMPAHPMALELIGQSGVPIAAPSVNRFTQLSATSAEHVRESFPTGIEVILDGGTTPVGIESTVLSLAEGHAKLLRPGMVTREEIEELIGPVEIGFTPGTGSHSSPGQHLKHYSPRTRLLLVRDGAVPSTGHGVYLKPGGRMPAEAHAYAAALYATLHALDSEHLDWIAVEEVPASPEWAGIRDRLRHAAS